MHIGDSESHRNAESKTPSVRGKGHWKIAGVGVSSGLFSKLYFAFVDIKHKERTKSMRKKGVNY